MLHTIRAGNINRIPGALSFMKPNTIKLSMCEVEIGLPGNNTDDQEGRQPKMPQEEMQYPVQTICVILGGSHGLVLLADFHSSIP